MVDAASWPLLTGGAGEPVLAAAALAGALLANRDEAAALAGLARPRRRRVLAGQEGRDGGGQVRPRRGGGLRRRRPPVPVPAPAVAAVDVTGAGDAFAAGYLLARAGGTGPAGAAAAGALLAAQAVATRGAWPALPTGGPPEYP